MCFEFNEYNYILRTLRPRICREVEHHLRNVFGIVEPYVLSSCPSASSTGIAASGIRRRSLFYLQWYNTRYSKFVNVDSVDEIMEGDTHCN